MISVTPFFEFVLVAVGIGSFAILLLAMLAAMGRASSLVSRLYFVAGSAAVASRVARWRRGFCYITDIASWKVLV